MQQKMAPIMNLLQSYNRLNLMRVIIVIGGQSIHLT